MNLKNTQKLLQEFKFSDLFIEELGWNNPKNNKKLPLQTEGCFKQPIAELAGAVVLEITTAKGDIPDSKIRAQISAEVQKTNFEHILVFVNQNRTDTLWRWLKRQDKKTLSREHEYHKGQTGNLFIAKIAGLFTDISELEQDLTIVDVANKMKNALDIEKVTKKFFKEYQERFELFQGFIEGIESEKDRKWYASVVLNRLMFIYFLQKKGFLDKGNFDYLKSKLAYTQQTFGQDKFYAFFLHRLFFQGFAKSEQERSTETNQLIGKIKYLNGGLFLPQNTHS
jgi:hypothetical protein